MGEEKERSKDSKKGLLTLRGEEELGLSKNAITWKLEARKAKGKERPVVSIAAMNEGQTQKKRTISGKREKPKTEASLFPKAIEKENRRESRKDRSLGHPFLGGGLKGNRSANGKGFIEKRNLGGSERNKTTPPNNTRGCGSGKNRIAYGSLL